MVGNDSSNVKLMTLQDVAEYLQIAERTVYQWAQTGKIPAFKLGSIWRFRRSDIDLWLEERKQDTPRSREIAESKKIHKNRESPKNDEKS